MANTAMVTATVTEKAARKENKKLTNPRIYVTFQILQSPNKMIFEGEVSF